MGEQESILLFQLGDVYLPVYLRYGTKRLERGRNVKADAEEEQEEMCPSRYGLNKFVLSKDSFREDPLDRVTS